MYHVMKALVLPPAGLLLLAAAGLALNRRRLAAAALAGLWLLALPAVADLLMAAAERGGPPLPSRPAGAIVVLSAGMDPIGVEYGGPTVDAMTLQRLRYAARLGRETGLPLLVSGGAPQDAPARLAELMRDTLQRDFAMPVRWLEPHSLDTWENAVFSAKILAAAGIDTVHLVTHAFHMARARDAFARAGIASYPAATLHTRLTALRPADLVPSASALHRSYYALHELTGRLWYRLRHGLRRRARARARMSSGSAARPPISPKKNSR